MLQECEENFRHFVEGMNDCYCVLQESRVVFANARGAEMFGYERDEVIGKDIRELLPSHLVEELKEIYMRRRRGETAPPQYQTTLIRKDGTALPVEFGARIIEYAGKPAVSLVTRDITERKLIEEALRESEVRFRTVFEGAAIGIALVGMNGDPLEINPALEQMLGYSLKDFGEMTASDYLHREDAMLDAALFEEIVAGKRDHYDIEKRYTSKDGRVVWVHQTLSLVRDAEGEPEFIIAMIEDITRRKNAEEERHKLEQQLQLAGRLAAVGELAAGVAHELNNPLTAIQAFAEFLSAREDLDANIRSDVETIYREARRATRITSNLLSFARRHEPEKRLISINETLWSSLELHAYRMKLQQIEVSIELASVLPLTMADPHQMHQVFVNVITNAEQAMTEAHGKGKLRIRTQKAGTTIRISFTDNGPGISEDNLRRIFDPFFTTKEVGQGTGLGLSICYGIVEGHNGQIYAKSKLGRGTTFVVELPIVAEDLFVAGAGGSIEAQSIS
jgi:PAS domain S-box-containing protein